jgi:hypothetical protein
MTKGGTVKKNKKKNANVRLDASRFHYSMYVIDLTTQAFPNGVE